VRITVPVRACTTFVALAGALVATPTASADPAGAGQHPPSAHVYVTTADRTELLNDRGQVAFQPGPAADPAIAVDATQRFQRMEGFGASITDSSAGLLYRLDPGQRDTLMRDLFDPEHGDGLGYLRQPMGASDFVDEPHYTYDDVPAGQTDYGMRRFSIAHDRAQILPLLRRARQLNPRLKIMATPWSPPAWMKTNGSLVGGRLIDEPRIYQAYARYFVKFLKAYADAGAPVDTITVQNEPQNRSPSGYPGMDMPEAQQIKFIEVLGPALRAAGLRTKILAYDHNWSMHPNDIASTPPGETPETEYPFDVLNSPAARWVAGTAFHCYAGDPERQSQLHDAFPDKDIYFTECSGSHGADEQFPSYFEGTLRWHTRNVVIHTIRNWAKTVINWNLALDPAGGPHNGGCDTCTGVVAIAPDGTITRNAEYYTLGHVARFVKPGAVRIASTSWGGTGWGDAPIMDVAFRNPDGSTVLLVLNDNAAEQSFGVAADGNSFNYTLPPHAVATFTWG
jgi:glucosylceramidase